ncbi:hypothetical protein C8R44DRAFT_984989 [Mycena epipterygia]|nr:hypothetical protein C8R44DRAFT_984989 [Mycena epipterygia]
MYSHPGYSRGLASLPRRQTLDIYPSSIEIFAILQVPSPGTVHKRKRYNSVVNRSDVVQPLVGLNDTFDIAVTVWQRATQDESLERARLLRKERAYGNRLSGVKPEFFLGPNATPELEQIAALYHAMYARWYEERTLHEKTIFSDIVFRGIRLSDTDIHRNVTFQIPTEVFANHELAGSNYDLRASFVIIPHSPSPLDHLKILKPYSSWLPDAVNRPRFKSFPFPLKSPTDFYWRPVDGLLDSFAIMIPLLERHEVASMCPPATNDSVHDIVGGEYKSSHAQVDDGAILQKHPHVITRTHLRVVRESRLFRRDAYLDMHEGLRNTSCGQHRPDGQPAQWKFCQKGYMWNGNWETMVNLEVPDPEAEGGFREESAYAPYMDVLRNAAGPKDIVPVPINRERCVGDAIGNRPISDYMNITWHLSYSSPTPRMFFLGDIYHPPLQRSHYTDSDWTRTLNHEAAEIQASLLGHRYNENSHPRRRLARIILYTLTFFLVLLLDCVYWASRRSTTFISVPGALCIVAGEFLALGVGLRNGLWTKNDLDDEPFGKKVLSLVLKFGSDELPLPLFIIHAVSPVELSCAGVLVPQLRRVRATHQERTSARLDARTDWRWKCGIFMGLLLAHYTLDLHGRFLVTPVLLQTQPGDRALSLPTDTRILVDALKMSGAIMQLILNYRAKVFAGRYKGAVVGSVLVSLLEHAGNAPRIVGRSEVMGGVSHANVVWDILLVLNCWQAWSYSSRIPAEEDGEDGK